MTVAEGSSYRISGSGQSPVDRFYDWLREGVSGKLAEWMAAKLAGVGSGFLLEAGCGSGGGSAALSKRIPAAVPLALDADLGAAREARSRCPAARAIVGDLNRLPLRDGAVALCWSSSTVEHLPDTARVLGEMARVTRDGGALFVGVPCSTGPLALRRIAPTSGWAVWIGPVFGRAELEAKLREAGVAPVGSLTYFFRFFVGVLARKGSGAAR
jgi:SAM-dependent methyltransferase